MDYETLDAGKRLAMASALSTSPLLAGHGAHALDASRGEPAFAFELDGRTLAFVVEGLGTKSIIARQVLAEQGIDRFADVAYDTVAAIVNDLCCVGALPLVVNAYFATGASEWYREGARSRSLVEGWRRGCVDAGCAWGGGESPSLPGLVDEQRDRARGGGRRRRAGGPRADPRRAAGSWRRNRDRGLQRSARQRSFAGTSGRGRSGGRVRDGAAERDDAGRGAARALGDVRGAGRASCSRARTPLTYISHITGHGLLKLMRRPARLRYRIWKLPEAPEVLGFLVAAAGLDAKAAYSTFNMGAGYALYCAPGAGAGIVELAAGLGLRACIAGGVEEGPREVCWSRSACDSTAPSWS